MPSLMATSLRWRTHSARTNYIFDPTKPLMLMSDGSAIESSLLIYQWNPDLLTLDIVSTKSMLLTTALRNQAAIHREAFGVDRVMELAKPYLFQSTSPVNYLFTVASSISYVSRNKPFSSFLQTLSETMSIRVSCFAHTSPKHYATLGAHSVCYYIKSELFSEFSSFIYYS